MPKSRVTRLKLTAGQIDISDWQHDVVDEVAGLLREKFTQAVSDAIRLWFTDDGGAFIVWPIVFYPNDGRRPRGRAGHPLAIEFVLPQTKTGEAFLSFNLRDAIADDLDACREDGSCREGLSKLRDALREFADDIDAAVREAPEES